MLIIALARKKAYVGDGGLAHMSVMWRAVAALGRLKLWWLSNQRSVNKTHRSGGMVSWLNGRGHLGKPSLARQRREISIAASRRHRAGMVMRIKTKQRA